MNKCLFVIFLFVFTLFGAWSSSDSLKISYKLKMLRKASNGILQIKSSDSTADTTGIKYDPSTHYTYFPDYLLIDSSHIGVLTCNTSDGYDDKSLTLCAGGYASAGRSAWLFLAGEENANTGVLRGSSGNSGWIEWYAANGVRSSTTGFYLYPGNFDSTLSYFRVLKWSNHITEVSSVDTGGQLYIVASNGGGYTNNGILIQNESITTNDTLHIIDGAIADYIGVTDSIKIGTSNVPITGLTLSGDTLIVTSKTHIEKFLALPSGE
jgi:hypothetical protein